MIEIKTKEELNNVLSQSDDNQLIVVKFGAQWCAPCKMLGSVISKIEGELSDVATFYEVDVDEAEELCDEYRIMSVPVLFYFKGGLQVDKTTGGLSEQQLRKKIEENNNK